jgi:hypothetical protein
MLSVDGRNPKVCFLSYAKPDAARAEEGAHTLEAGGIACWMAPRDVPPGANWVGLIRFGGQVS